MRMGFPADKSADRPGGGIPAQAFRSGWNANIRIAQHVATEAEQPAPPASLKSLPCFPAGTQGDRKLERHPI